MSDPSTSSELSPRKWVRDSGLVLLILIGINAIFQSNDPGWIRHHPTPYVIIPILVGGRYGIWAGTFSGLFTGVLLVVVHALLLHTTFQSAWMDYTYQIVALTGIGVICGEIQGYFQRRIERDAMKMTITGQRLRELDGELTILREAKDRSDRLLALRDSEVAGLDVELRKLFASDTEDLYRNLLFLLNRTLRITDAGLYQVTASGELKRLALLGSEQQLDEFLRKDSHPMIAKAFEERKIISLPAFWHEGGEISKSEYLLVSPLLNHEGTPFALILVTGIPFIAMQKRTVITLHLIGNWVARMIESKTEDATHYRAAGKDKTKKIYHLPHYKKSFELSVQAQKTHSMASTIVTFVLPEEAGITQEEFENGVLATMRAGDVSCVLDLGGINLSFLLLLTGENGADIFATRILQYCLDRYPWGKDLHVKKIRVTLDLTFSDLLLQLRAWSQNPLFGPQ